VKTTIDLPEDLVTEIKVEAARQHRKLEDLVPELLRGGLDAHRQVTAPRPDDAKAWLEQWVAVGEAATTGLPPGPTAREILAADRDRL